MLYHEFANDEIETEGQKNKEENFAEKEAANPNSNNSRQGKENWKKAINKIVQTQELLKKMEDKFDPFRIPPNWDLAEKHQKATSVGYETIDLDSERKLCLCCGYQIVSLLIFWDLFTLNPFIKEKISVNLIEPASNLSFIGAGYPLYFNFLKNAILLTASMLLISGEFNIISNYISNNCTSMTSTQNSTDSDDGNSVTCVLDWVTEFSLVNKNNNDGMNTIQHKLNFLSVIGVIFFMLYYRKTQKELYMQIDWKETTPSDFAIIVENLPNDMTNIAQKLHYYFSEIDGKKYNIRNINLCYDLRERRKMHETFKRLLSKKKRLLKMKAKSYSIETEEEIVDINKEIIVMEREMRIYDMNLPHNPLSFCGTAIITFNTQKERKEILHKSTLNIIDRIKILFKRDIELPRGFMFHGARLIIKRAPEPNEILFHNLSSDFKEKIKYRLIAYLLTGLELSIFGIIIYYLLDFQYEYFTKEINQLGPSVNTGSSQQSSNNDQNDLLFGYQEMLVLLYLYSGCISLFIVVINNVFIEKITKAIVKMEKYTTYTKKKITLATRLSLILFFNNGILVYIICNAKSQITTPGGLIYTQYYVFILNAIGPIFTKWFDFPLLFKKLKIHYYQNYSPNGLTQKEANKLMQYPKYEIESFYAETVQSILFTAFYQCLLPFGIVWCVLSLTVLYFTHKILLLRRRSVTKIIGGGLSRNMTGLLELAIFITAYSNLTFEYQILGSMEAVDIIGLVISVIYFITPTVWLAEKLFFFKEEQEEKTYDEIHHKFTTTYDIENPVTSQKALREKLNLEKQKHYERFKKKNSGGTVLPMINGEPQPLTLNSPGKEKEEEEGSDTESRAKDHLPILNEDASKLFKKKTKSLVPGFVRVQEMEIYKKMMMLDENADLEGNEAKSELFTKTAELNQLNAQYAQLKECSALLSQELAELNLNPEELQTKLQTLQEEINTHKYKITEIKESRDNVIKHGIFEERAMEFSALESHLKSLQSQGLSTEGFKSAIERDSQMKIQQIKVELASIQKKKSEINEELSQKLEKLNEFLEKKAMIKEDLTGKLLQRAEAIAQREEYEELIEASIAKSTEFKLFSKLSSVREELAVALEERQMLAREVERKREESQNATSGLNSMKDRMMEIMAKIKDVEKEIKEKLQRNGEKNQESEFSLNEMAKKINVPELNGLLEFLSAKTDHFLEVSLLNRQLKLVEAEEANLNLVFDDEVRTLDQEISSKSSDKRRCDDLKRRKAALIKKKEERIAEIDRWKKNVREVIQKSGGEKNQETLRKTYNFENFEKTLIEIKGDSPLLSDFREFAFEYFAGLETQEFELRELENVQRILKSELSELQESVPTLLETSDALTERFNELHKRLETCEENVTRLHEIESELLKTLDKSISEKSKVAFGAYMAEQAGTFDKIARTYGKSTCETLERQHRESFKTIFRNGEYEKLAGILKAEKNCEKLEFLINFNMRTVDEVIIPNLKDLLIKVTDIKQEISELQEVQVSIIGEEDGLMNSLNEIQENFRTKVRESYKSEPDGLKKREAEIGYILIKMDEIRTEVAKNFQDFNENEEQPTKLLDLEEYEEEIEKYSENLQTLESRLLTTQIIADKFQEKQSQYAMIRQKLQELNRTRKLLEKEINFLAENPADYRSKSVPRRPPFEKNGALTDRIRVDSLHENTEQRFSLATDPKGVEPDPAGVGEKKCTKDCSRHQKKFRFNVETACFREIELFDNIRSLLEGIIIYKKFSNNQSLKQSVFDPRNPANPPENCGYGLRLATMNLFQEKLEFKSQAKVVESSIKLPRIFKTSIPGGTMDLLKQRENEKIKKKTKLYLPFSLILEEGGRVELIARSERDLRNFVNGINATIQAKKELASLREKLEVSCY